jgi:hypothetical protein
LLDLRAAGWKIFFNYVSITIMQLQINPRKNGACPLCESSGKCRIQNTLAQAVENFSDEDDPMELVVYSCPQFEEKVS